jgi:hypothetical protein
MSVPVLAEARVALELHRRQRVMLLRGEIDDSDETNRRLAEPFIGDGPANGGRAGASGVPARTSSTAGSASGPLAMASATKAGPRGSRGAANTGETAMSATARMADRRMSVSLVG